MLDASQLLKQSVKHTVAMSELITQVETRAIEWAEEYCDANPVLSLEVFRAIAYDRGCNLFDGEDGCVLNSDDCSPTEYEQEAIVSAYTWAAIQFVTTHMVAVEDL